DYTTYASVLDFYLYFFFNDTPTTEIYTLSLHDALPISPAGFSTKVEEQLAKVKSAGRAVPLTEEQAGELAAWAVSSYQIKIGARSEEHTSELQSRGHLVCRLLLEKKKQKIIHVHV